ncbi:hypothetical protein LY78DRAFT_21467 [Colletotrichum sublineola]|nr:hypothetical protein LY78DRAFT_21467 [Colletotrichum sublineola]
MQLIQIWKGCDHSRATKFQLQGVSPPGFVCATSIPAQDRYSQQYLSSWLKCWGTIQMKMAFGCKPVRYSHSTNRHPAAAEHQTPGPDGCACNESDRGVGDRDSSSGPRQRRGIQNVGSKCSRPFITVVACQTQAWGGVSGTEHVGFGGRSALRAREAMSKLDAR